MPSKKKKKLTAEEVQFQDLMTMLGSLGMLGAPMAGDPRLRRPGDATGMGDQGPRPRTASEPGSYYAPGMLGPLDRRLGGAQDRSFRRSTARSKAGYGPNPRRSIFDWRPELLSFATAAEDPETWKAAYQRERTR